MRLNQVIAIEKGVKAQATRELTDAHRVTQRPELLSGISRSYRPKDEEGERLPGESTRVQTTVEDVNHDVHRTLRRLLDVTATKDVANTQASAPVLVDGEELLPKLPPTFLLFLEKQLQELRTYFTKLPTLDPAFDWTPDSVSGVYKTPVVETSRTQKLPRNHVLAPATKEHPAQVQMFTEDKTVGYWDTVKFSGAITEERRRQLVDRVDKLLRAVKFAREEANSATVTEVHVGDTVFEYLLAE